ncbi:PHP domain-like protein [Armillaria mellea]|nr:PHP domain-like protein [Armillaria mellea]
MLNASAPSLFWMTILKFHSEHFICPSPLSFTKSVFTVSPLTAMYDLNIPISFGENGNKKGKGKQTSPTEVRYTPAQISAIESRIDMLSHLGYNVIAFTQTVAKKVDPKTHVNILDPLLGQLTPRKGIVYLKRLSIILDGDSEKGFGLINAQTTLFNTYDLLSLPLKSGAVFEITYNDATLVDVSAAENGASAKRNWWGAARELARVCKGKGIIVSSGAASRADLRAPGDIGNLIALLGVPQDVAHSSMSKTPKSLVLRAQTRKTHRAVLSEPRLVIPEGYQAPIQPPETTPSVQTEQSHPRTSKKGRRRRNEKNRSRTVLRDYYRSFDTRIT